MSAGLGVDQERTAYLAIGSNIQPQRHVPACLALLRAAPEFTLTRVSSLYRTAAWGGETDAEFVNLVVAVRTRLTAGSLLSQTQHIEALLGRVRGRRYAARTIDIDLLLLGDELHGAERLSVPHPGLLERDFMLIPLLEIAPDAVHPATGERLAEYCDRLRYRQIILKTAVGRLPGCVARGD